MSRFALDDAGSGPPVLLLHGFPATRGLWKDVAPRLAAAGFRMLAPDLIGYGASPDEPDVGMERQAGWLLELLDELRIERATVVAHDVGTAAAQILTVRSPARVRRLILMDGVFETEWAMGAVESIRSWDPAQAARLQPVLVRKLRSIRDLLGAYAGETGGRRLIHAARCLDPRQTEGMTARLKQTGVPIRLIWGADDAYLPVDTVGRPLAAALGVELEVLPGGHFLPLDNPEALARKLIELIQTNAAP
ncbi:MAG TPA: alpha/beta hydrolase [Myxococcales bacterium]|nr:alpha/beta hydrolase [Myxococcales bacterium]